MGLTDNGQVYELIYIEETVTPVNVEETIAQEDVNTKTSEWSEESDAKLPRHCRLIASSLNIIEIQTDFDPVTDVLFEAARDKFIYEQGVFLANSVAKVSEKGKVMITAVKVTE